MNDAPFPYQPGRHAGEPPDEEQGMRVIQHRPLDAILTLLWVPIWTSLAVGTSYYIFGSLFRASTLSQAPILRMIIYGVLPVIFVLVEAFLLFFYLYHRDSRVEIGNGRVRVIRHGHLVAERILTNYTRMRTRYSWRRAGYNLCFEGDTNVPLPVMLSWKFPQIRRALKKEKQRMRQQEGTSDERAPQT